jgi:hypothetical protein
MTLKVDYYTSLLRAVGGLDRDAYAARGAIYEREHKALMRLLFSADPPHSQAEIEKEQLAFRDAVRRVEFGDDEHQIPLVPLGESHQVFPPRAAPLAAAPASVIPLPATRTTATPATVRRATVLPAPGPAIPATAPPAPAAPAIASPAIAPPTPARVPELDWSSAEPPVDPQDDPADEIDPRQSASAVEPELALEPDAIRPAAPGVERDHAARKRKPISGLLLRRAVLAVVLLGLGAVGYGYATGDLDLPWLTELVGDGTLLQLGREPDAQQAIVIDGDVSNPDAIRAAGKAVWRLRTESAEAPGAATTTVLQLDLEIPQRRLAMTMSMRREAAGSAMSHLIELRFLREDRAPDGDIANIGGLFMTTAEWTRRAPLSGRVVRVAPGVFLFGLAGLETDREQNLRSLQELAWMVIPLAYRNGARGFLAVEKGAAGERVINEVLAK